MGFIASDHWTFCGKVLPSLSVPVTVRLTMSPATGVVVEASTATETATPLRTVMDTLSEMLKPEPLMLYAVTV